MAIKAKHPNEKIEERAAEIRKLETAVATKQAKVGSEVAKIELNHEEKYQNVMSGLKETKKQAEEALRVTRQNKGIRLEEVEVKYREEKQIVEDTFTKFDVNGVEAIQKADLAIAEAEATHKLTMERVKAVRKTKVSDTTTTPAGMIKISVPSGVSIITPELCNIDHIQGTLSAAAQTGFLQGTSPEFLTQLAAMVLSMMNQTAMTSEQIAAKQHPLATPPAPTGGTTGGATGTTGGTKQEESVLPPTKRTRQREDGDASMTEEGSGQAYPKQPKEGETEEQFDNLG